MNKATVMSTVIITAILTMILALLLLVGGAVVFVMYGALEEFVFIYFALIGVGLFITSLPTVISDVFRVVKSKEIVPVVFSGTTLLLSVFLVCEGIGSIGLFYVSFNNQGEMDMILHSINLVIGSLVAGCLVLLPVLSMICSKSRALQFRVEIHKPLIGIVIEMLLLTHLFADELASKCGIILEVFGVITAVFAIVHLIVGLAGLSKAMKRVKEKEKNSLTQSDSVLQTVQKKPIDLPFNLPAGVNADDF